MNLNSLLFILTQSCSLPSTRTSATSVAKGLCSQSGFMVNPLPNCNANPLMSQAASYHLKSFFQRWAIAQSSPGTLPPQLFGSSTGQNELNSQLSLSLQTSIPDGEGLALAGALRHPGSLLLDIIEPQPVGPPVLALVLGHSQPPGVLQSLELLLVRDLRQVAALGPAVLDRLPVGGGQPREEITTSGQDCPVWAGEYG